MRKTYVAINVKSAIASGIKEGTSYLGIPKYFLYLDNR